MDAFKKLSNYLDEHPGEFFVIHLFRGNVTRAIDNATGCENSDEARSTYNRLMGELFNEGDFSKYIVDYSPTLRVKDIRGKIVVFRRDRIDFADIKKAANLSNWPGDKENWTEGQMTIAVNASDIATTGKLWVTDVSSPKDEAALQVEMNSITNLYNANISQIKPNEARANGPYTPRWSMCFTSGAYGSYIISTGTKNYLQNAEKTNPLMTSLIKDSEKKGPCGIIFSDWVLTDSHKYSSTTYKTMGVDLVPTIAYNNFDYAADFIIDDDIFVDSEEAINYWDESKEYYMLNVGTNGYLGGGLLYNTHAAITYDKPIVVTPVLKDGYIYLYTKYTQGNVQNAYGKNDYIDNNGDHRALFAKRVGSGKYIFKYKDNGAERAIGAGDLVGEVYNVCGLDLNENDPMQQWVLVDPKEYYNKVVSAASPDNGVDISHFFGNFTGNGPDNASWNLTADAKVAHGVWTENSDDSVPFLYANNEKKPSFPSTGWNDTWNTKWSFSKTFENLPNGKYIVKFDVVRGNHPDASVSLNDNEVIKKDDTSICYNSSGSLTGENARDLVKNGDYTYTSEVIIVTNGQIKISGKCNNSSNHTGSATRFYMGNVKLIYYGPDPETTAAEIKKAIDDANANIAKLPENLQEGWAEEIAPFQTIVDNKEFVADAYSVIRDIYSKVATRVIKNTVENADMTGLIFNNSFEYLVPTSNQPNGWEFSYSSDTAVKENSGDLTTTNGHGPHFFNTFWQGLPLKQTISELPAGHYKLQALVASGSTDGGDVPHYIYLTAFEQHSEKFEFHDKNTFLDIDFTFDVPAAEDVTIGIQGAMDGGEFDENKTWFWYKADNFRLTYLGAPDMQKFYDKIQTAIDRATAVIDELPSEYQQGWDNDMAQYLDIIEDQTLEGDGTNEVNAIYSLMQNYVVAAAQPGANLTGAIINNSFEFSDAYGWKYDTLDDTRVVKNSNGTYTIGTDCHGDYLFNTYDNGGNLGSELTQVIPNLPAGHYRLEAMMTSFENHTLELFANDNVTRFTTTHDQFSADNISVEFTLNEPSDVSIGTRGINSWYKVDNFRLTYVSPLNLLTIVGEYNEVNRSLQLIAVDNNGNVVPDAVIFYTDTADSNEAPTNVINEYSDAISYMSTEQDRLIYVWASANAPGYDNNGQIQLVEGAPFSVAKLGITVAYIPVSNTSHIKEGYWYLLVARHEVNNTHHAMSKLTNESGHYHSVKVIPNDNNEIVADEAGFANVHEFTLSGSEDSGYTLVSKDKEIVLGASVVPASTKSRTLNASNGITINLNDDGITPATVTIPGVGFHSESQTFGDSADHSGEMLLYTTASEMNTGIESVNVALPVNDAIYNLQGIRLETPWEQLPAGIYIKGGVKIKK